MVKSFNRGIRNHLSISFPETSNIVIRRCLFSCWHTALVSTRLPVINEPKCYSIPNFSLKYKIEGIFLALILINSDCDLIFTIGAGIRKLLHIKEFFAYQRLLHIKENFFRKRPWPSFIQN